MKLNRIKNISFELQSELIRFVLPLLYIILKKELFRLLFFITKKGKRYLLRKIWCMSCFQRIKTNWNTKKIYSRKIPDRLASTSLDWPSENIAQNRFSFRNWNDSIFFWKYFWFFLFFIMQKDKKFLLRRIWCMPCFQRFKQI